MKNFPLQAVYLNISIKILSYWLYTGRYEVIPIPFLLCLTEIAVLRRRVYSSLPILREW